LHYAVERDDSALAGYLIEQGSAVDCQDREGYAPLHLASSECLSLLIHAGANIDVKDHQGNSPLASAVKRERYAEVRSLLAAGSDARSSDADGRTPLHWSRSAATSEALIAHGADVNRPNQAGRTPIFEVDAGSVEALVNAGADLNGRDAEGDTPLHAAAEVSGDGNLAKVRALLAAGVDGNARDREGQTSLHRAVRGWDAPLLGNSYYSSVTTPDAGKVAALLDAGASPDIADRHGVTPRELAVRLGRPEIVRAFTSRVRGGARAIPRTPSGSALRKAPDPSGGMRRWLQRLLGH
jgi:ankyrin repeat protein